ncbi:phage tail spike protein [Streptococcus uberis]|uniref:phage tail spike protein n=1 Tax=Streptococcus uberis TaxID=1349 RepID=UPI0038D490DC
MLLTIHDANLRKVAFIDNDKQATLNYFNDTWTRYLETGSSTFDFTVFKKAIISDVGRKRAYNYLNEKAFVSFQYKGKTYLHTIRKIEENEKTIKCYGINLNLELINEYANPYKATKAMTFKEYCDAMDLLNFTFLKIGVNEVSTQKITAEWEGADTKLNRLLSLAKKFGAEIEFDTYLNADSSIKSFVINVYHENDDTHQGVGRISPTVLTYGKNLKTLTRTVDKTNIYNMVRPTGRTDNGDIVTISGLSAWSVNNAKGEREFYQAGEGLYAPLSMQMYPSAFTSKTTNDQWIRKDMQVESSNPDVIRSMAYRELKKNCYPAVTYEAEGFADLEIGDTVQVYDDGFSPVLLLEMRVSEQSISFTNPKNNKTTFSNAKALENRLSGGIQQRIDQMIEDAKPYTIKVATDNGVGFKNGQGQSVVTPTLMKGNKVINSGWRWVVDGIIKSTSPSYIVKATDINHTMVLTITAWVDNKEVASEQITFINTVDGTAGRGIASVDTYYLLTGMSAGVTRDIAGWTQTVKTPTSNQRFVWSYRVENYSDGTSSVGEPYILSIYGEKGDTGPQGLPGTDGLQGEKGDQGIPGPAGADGKTKYTHIAYASKSKNVLIDAMSNFASYGGYQGSVVNVIKNGASYDVATTGGTHTMKQIITFNGTSGKTVWYYVKIKNTGTNALQLIFNGISASGTSSYPTVTVNPGQTYVKFEQGICRTSYDFIQMNIGSMAVDKDLKYTVYEFAIYNEIPFVNFVVGSNTNGEYLGMYQDFTEQDSTDPAKYNWSLIKGQDGAQGIPGPPGDDGKTYYWHTAYANSADGKTDFSLTDSTNKQYLGQYTDNIQADSTDPNKYKWVNMVGTVKVGGSNILLNSRFENTSTDPYSFTVGGVTYDTKPDYWSLYNSGIPNATTSYHAYVDNKMSTTNVIAFNESDGSRNWKAINQTVSSRVPKTSKDFMISLDMYATGTGTKAYGGFYYVSKSTGAFNFHAGQFNIVPREVGKWVRESAKVPFNPDDCDFTKEIRFYIYGYGFTTNSILYIDKIMLENSNVASDYSDAPEELQAKIDSKADGALTQEQLNALNEKAGIIQAELDAKASADTLDNWIKAYQDFVKANDVARAQAENDLISASQRVSTIAKNLGELSDRWNFIDTYMSSSNDGLVIGKNDGSSSMLFSPNGRISMFSAGVEVMYISQGVIHIENGIFSKTIQIGRFREEQYHLNPDMNVIRYVG